VATNRVLKNSKNQPKAMLMVGNKMWNQWAKIRDLNVNQKTLQQAYQRESLLVN
jgi:hypothetical protein